jgi:5,10-methylene-tetrahydrofolate dehydrogenase/methenyl tetrahydrofolate cyclohydrolase
LTRETLTVVGYGTDDFVKGSVVSAKPVVIDDGIRSYRHVTAITQRRVPGPSRTESTVRSLRRS